MPANHTNGKPSGANGRANGKSSSGSNVVVSSRSHQQKKKKRGLIGWTVNNVARLAIWYTIITAVFRCPSSLEELTDESSKVCRPYLQARTHLDPHLKPYYEHYVEPYVVIATPYYEQFHSSVYTPALATGKLYYEKYAAPQVEVAQALALEKWDQVVRPQLDVVSVQAKAQYDKSLAPHVEKVTPYYETTKDGVQDMYNKQVLPAYHAVQPHVNTAIGQAQKHWHEIGRPYSVWALSNSRDFLDRTVWPRLRILYGENVEPQIIRITERLGRYRDEQKLKAAVDDLTEPPTPEDPQGTHVNPADSVVSSSLADEASTAHSEPSEAPETDEEREARLKTSIEEDLSKWRRSWEGALSRGVDDLYERIHGLSRKLIKSQIDGVGQSLLKSFDRHIGDEISSFKSGVLAGIRKLPESPSAQDVAAEEEAVTLAARKAGGILRSQAQKVRDWKVGCDTEAYQLVTAAGRNTVEVVEKIRNSGLEEIERKWTTVSESDTYADWSRYHTIYTDFMERENDNFGEKKLQIEYKHALGNPAYLEMRSASDDIEAIAMAKAEDLARELIRLKGVALWKVKAQDSSDDFSDKVIPPEAKQAINKVIDAAANVRDNIVGTSQGTVESVASEASGLAESIKSKVAASAEAVKSQASEAVVGSEEPVVSKVAASAESIKKQASEAIVGSEEPVVSSVASAAKSSAASASSRVAEIIEDQKSVAEGFVESQKSVVSQASEAAVGSSTPAYESVASDAASSIQSVASQAKEAVVGSSTPAYESVASDVSKSAESVASAASEAVVGSSTPIYESAASEVSSNVEDVSSSASSVASSVLSAASASSDSLQSAASEAVVGSETPAYESVASKASKSVESASKAASSAASKGSKSASKVFAGAMAQAVEYNAPILDEDVDADDYTRKVSSALDEANSQAFSRYSEITKAVSDALLKATATKGAVENFQDSIKERYAHAMQAAGQAMYGREPSVGEKVADAASSRFSEAVNAASSIFYGDSIPPPGKTPIPHMITSQMQAGITGASSKASNALSSISAVASSRLADSIWHASEQFEIAKTWAGATPTPAHQQYLDAAQKQYYQAVGAAQAEYSNFVSSASIAVYGTPAPVAAQKQFDDAVSRARETYASVVSSASSIVGDLSKSIDIAPDASAKAAAQLAYENSKRGYDRSLQGAAKIYRAISEDASKKLYGTATPVHQSVASQASANWEELVKKASEQIYGTATPWYEAVYSQAGSYGAQASAQAGEQYAAVAALVSELIQGKEPTFTDSVLSRFSSAYYTGAPAAASSVSSAVSEGYANAASAFSSAFVTPSARLDEILDRANEQVAAAVAVASVQVYGTQAGYAEAAQSSILAAGESASSALSVAIYGTPTGAAEAATSKVAEAYESASKAASEALYGSQKGAIESAQSRLNEALSSASATLSSYAVDAGTGASEAISKAQEAVKSAAGQVKDEL